MIHKVPIHTYGVEYLHPHQSRRDDIPTSPPSHDQRNDMEFGRFAGFLTPACGTRRQRPQCSEALCGERTRVRARYRVTLAVRRLRNFPLVLFVFVLFLCFFSLFRRARPPWGTHSLGVGRFTTSVGQTVRGSGRVVSCRVVVSSRQSAYLPH